MAVKSAKRRRSVSVDMEGVESGGKLIPDGSYRAKIESIEEKESKQENPMLVVKWKVLSGKGKGGLVFDNVSLTPQALWRLKGLLEALEIEVPDGAMDLDLDDLVEQECTIQITNEKYEGRDRPKVTAYGSAGEEDEEEDEEEEQDERVGKKPKKPAKPAKDEEEEETEDDSEDEDEDEDDEDEEEDEKPSSKKPKPSGKSFKKGQRVSFKDEKDKVIKGVVLEVDGDTVKVEDKAGGEWEIEASELTAL